MRTTRGDEECKIVPSILMCHFNGCLLFSLLFISITTIATTTTTILSTTTTITKCARTVVETAVWHNANQRRN